MGSLYPPPSGATGSDLTGVSWQDFHSTWSSGGSHVYVVAPLGKMFFKRRTNRRNTTCIGSSQSFAVCYSDGDYLLAWSSIAEGHVSWFLSKAT